MNATTRNVREEALQAFAATIAELFQMPAELALEQVNRELAANPLTSDIHLEVPSRHQLVH